ncbi:MAG: autotransporter-associated beta strand repeat-containing protein [Verrucomicrobia bacterium]|nr:autotransporter-associated beta strand repeat-containing protein [Verrucomicrobiota bacterium]
MNNWTDTLPSSAYPTNITMQGILNTTNDMDIAGLAIKGLTISNSAAAFVIGGAGSFTNLGTGTSGGILNLHNQIVTISNNWVLDGANTWTSSSNTLDIVGNVNLANYTLTLANTPGAFNPGNTNIIKGIISGTGGLTITGTGTNVLTGVNTYSGATTISGGVLTSGAAGVIGDSSAVTVTSPGALNLDNNSETVGSLAGSGNVTLGSATLTTGGDNTSTTYSGIISGSGGINKAGTGMWTLAGTNLYTGTTSISAGTLLVATNNALGTAAGPTTVSSGASLGFSNNVNYATAEAVTINGVGVGSLGAIQNVANTNTFAGAITLGSASAIGAAAGQLTLSGAIDNGGFLLTMTNGNAGAKVIITGDIGGAGGLTSTGAGTNFLNSTLNTYSGPTTIAAGVLTLGSGSVIPNGSAVTVNSPGVLNLNNTGENIGSLAGSGNVDLGTGYLNAGADDTSTAFSGVISGAGGDFGKYGTGTQTFSGANTFTGNTVINAGTISLTTNNALGGTTNITINANGTLLLNGGTGTLINNAAVINMNGGTFNANDLTETMSNLTLSANSTVSLLAGTVSTLTFSGVSTRSAGTLAIDNWTGSPWTSQSGIDDAIFFTGNAGQNLAWISFTGFTAGAYVLGGGEVVPVPEPSTILSGLLLMGLLARRMRRDKSPSPSPLP